MATRPYVSFAEVKRRVPIPDALHALGIAEQFQRKGDVLSGVCPLPGHEHGPSPNPEQFKIDRKTGTWLWHCFGDCQRGGDVVELVKSVTGHDDAHVRFWFAENFRDRLETKRPKKEKEAETKKACEESGKTLSPQAEIEDASKVSDSASQLKPLRFFLDLKPDVPYLTERGVLPETIKQFGLGLCRRGVLKGYVAIPVYGWPKPESENPVAYLGRWPGDDFDADNDRPRYKWPEGFTKSKVAYGLHEALASGSDEPLIVVEGPFKVYHLVQAGYANTVAIFGSSLSDEQAAILKQTGRPIILLFDGDDAGRQGMRTAAAKLITDTFVRVVRLADGKQPDDLSPAELKELLG